MSIPFLCFQACVIRPTWESYMQSQNILIIKNDQLNSVMNLYNHHFCPGFDKPLLILFFFFFGCYLCIYKWFDWTFFLNAYNTKWVTVPLIIYSVILFLLWSLLMSPCISLDICCKGVQHSRHPQMVRRRWSYQSAQKQHNWLVCDHINSNLTVVRTDISITGCDIWSSGIWLEWKAF